MNNIDILEEGIKKMIKDERIHDDYRNMITAISTLIAENKELKEEHNKFMEGELYTAKQLKNIEKDRNKYYIHKSKVEEVIEELKKKDEENLINGEYFIKILQSLLGKE